jgi:hypothetical protein
LLTAYIPLIKLTTRAGSQYIYLSEVNIISTNVLPITVNNVTDDVVSVKGVGFSLSTLNVRLNTFWEMLMRRGGTWMWDYVSDRSNDTGWLMTALQQGSAVLATDGSYSRIRGPTVCRAGWVFACRRSRRILCGSFYKFSTNASAYRGELLGLVALHTLVLHICKHYHLREAKEKIICDSQSALRESGRRRRQIRPGAAQGDIFLTLRTIHQEM